MTFSRLPRLARLSRLSLTSLLLAAALCSSGCVILHMQRIDSLTTPECKSQMQQGIEQMLITRKESPEVARTLATSAVDQMIADSTANTPRTGSHLAADLRVRTTEAKVASSSGTVYDIYANRSGGQCELLIEGNDQASIAHFTLTRCTCEDSQD